MLSLLPVVLFSSASVLAGGGPEGLLLVVNPQSQSSLTIANHYARLRQVPLDNVLYLPWDPKTQTTDINTFRRQILIPVLQTIQNRRLADQIDSVVYAADFPWGISLDSDIRKFAAAAQKTELSGGHGGKKSEKGNAGTFEWPKHLTPVGSLNGLTFLWQAVAAEHPAYLQLQNNFYACPSFPVQSFSEGFRGNRLYHPPSSASTPGGQRYFLSTMLGVTAGRGNSLDEVIHYLERSAASDGTHPKGAIYFVKNSDVRSKARHESYPIAVEELTKLGVAAEILNGTLPLNKRDVQGVMMGTANFDWKASDSVILPGAIGDNFTSFGGIMHKEAGQTPLSEFLRYGAAGSCGTVTEPYAIPDKFPSPLLQVHYARGCTLAEAFYQSVRGPYQLLIVGDPLCRPWAEIPQVSATGIRSGDAVRGTLSLAPVAVVAKGKPVNVFELFVDGRRAAECKPGASLTLDTTLLADGYHELRVVAVGPGPIESQGRLIIPVKLDNHGRKIEASLATKGPLRPDMPLAIAVRSPGSVGIVAIQGSRIVGRLVGEQGQIEIPANALGSGPVQVRIAGLGEGGPKTNVLAEPIEFTVE